MACKVPFAQWIRGCHSPFLGTNQFFLLLRNQQGGNVPNSWVQELEEIIWWAVGGPFFLPILWMRRLRTRGQLALDPRLGHNVQLRDVSLITRN